MLHHDHSKKADIWTILGTLGEGFAHTFLNYYWGVSIADLAFSTEEDAAKSPIPATVGALFALFSIGSMYAHQKLNTFHQNDNHEGEEQNVLTVESQNEKKPSETHLSKRQKLALISDFFSHTGDISGAVITGINSVTRNYQIPRYGNVLIQLGATFVGAVTSVASVRSCRHAIKSQNEEKHLPQP